MDLTDPGGYDMSVEDPERRGEMELTAQLIVAANESSTALSDGDIDRILGISPPP